jgi:hypothetical protein
MPDLLPYQQALKAFNDYCASEFKDGISVIESIIRHNDLLEKIEQLPQEERLTYIGSLASEYSDMILKYLTLHDEYVLLRLEHDAVNASERPEPTDIEKKYFPIATDEFDYWKGKDEGTVIL